MEEKINFIGMSPANAAQAILMRAANYGSVYDFTEQDILDAIQHFSNRNLIAARRWAYMKKRGVWDYAVQGAVLAAEAENPDL